MKILGIETSHDDASVALLCDEKVEIILTISQIEFHQKFGGTIPELAAREHSRNLAIILEKLLQKRVDFSSIDAIAYTNNPGLLGALKIGFLFANALSLYFNKPLIPVNHLLGHFWSANIDDEIVFPALSLLISGVTVNEFWLKMRVNLKLLAQQLTMLWAKFMIKLAEIWA